MRSKILRWAVCKWLVATCVFGIFSMAANAQLIPGTTQETEAPVTLDEPLSREAVREMVATLSDNAVRALLIERLDAVAEARAAADAADMGVFGVLGEGVSRYWSNAKQSVTRTGEIPDKLDKAWSAIQQEMRDDGISRLLLIILLALAAGVIAERLVTFLFRKKKQQLIDEFSTTLSGILRILYTRLSIDVLGVLGFWAVAHVVISANFPRESIPYLAAQVPLSAALGGWMGFVICRFFFAPSRPDLRICQTSDERAAQLTTSFSLLALYILMIHNAFYLLMTIGQNYYVDWRFIGALGFYMNLSLYLAAAATILYNHASLTEVLTENKRRVFMAIGEEAPADLSWFAVHWPNIALLLIAAKYLMVEIVIDSTDVGIYSTAAVYITFIVIFLWPGIDANVSLFVAKGVSTPENESESAGRARRTMQQGLLRVGRVVVVGAVLFALAKLWGLNILDLAEAGLGAQAAGALVELAFLLLLAYLAWELVSIIIGYWLAAEGGDPNDGDGEGAGEIGGVGLSRVATLLPIIRKTAQFVIVLVSVIMVLDNWGVNIGPILAGAGVVGLAIGFGAQTLVKDIVSGLFFLADDAFRVGEYIDVDGTMGNVEKISLRSLRLRHHRGLVHTIPYGEIPKLTNYSRDWVIMKLRFRVPFETDINKVKKIFKQIGKDLLEHPELGPDFLQPFKSQGVAEVDENGIVVRGKFMAKPGKQFMIRKEVYVQVQKAFEEAGIPFARKQVMVHIPGLEKSDELNPEDVKSIGAAAAEAAEEQVETEAPRKNE